MGFLSKLWSGVKNVFSGILKVFSPILAPLGKILGSSWGKVLMLAASVFTFGASLLAGAGAFGSTLGATGSFMEAFVAGGKQFVSTLLGTGASPGGGEIDPLIQGAVQTATDPLATNMLSDVGKMTPLPGGATPNSLTKPGGANIFAGSGGAKELGMQAMQAGTKPGLLTQGMKAGGTTKTGGNWLTNAAKSAWEFAKSEPGQNLIGSSLEGYAQGKRDEALFEHEGRYDRMWQDPNQTRPIGDITSGFGPDVPTQWNRNPSATARRRISTYKPSVDFRRTAPQGVGG